MKRKNIFKFVSLLGIGSFVMLAAASCSQAASPTQNPSSRTELGGSAMMDMPSGNDNTNINQDMTNAVDTELRSARNQLSTLVDTENENTALYADYAKIQDTLKNAFAVARATVDKSDSTTQSLKDAKSTLESAISNANKEKTDFDEKNVDLVTAYNALKEALKNQKTNLDSVSEPNYAALKTNFVNLYNQAKTIVETTLIPITDSALNVENVMTINQNLTAAISRNVMWKRNADNLVNSFINQSILKKDITGVSESNSKVHPGNWSFVGYSVDVDNVNFDFAQRTVWAAEDSNTTTLPITNTGENSSPLTNVSWIYNLNNVDAKYTLSFRYFGASPTAYLYFPYKLVKDSDKSNVALQYKLNGEEAKTIDFKKVTQSESTGYGSSIETEGSKKQKPEETGEHSETTDSPTTPSTTIINEAPTVSDIKIAKIALSNLKFNLNTIEFSVPQGMGENMMKVAPMIGNMYITSSDNEANRKLIYDSIFGNTTSKEASKTAVTVDLLKGYSLATSYNMYVRQFTNLTDDKTPVYLVGLIGGNQPRFGGTNRIRQSTLENNRPSPNIDGIKRTFTIYVNAPQDGNYYISGQYLQGTMNMPRALKFSTQTTNNMMSEVTITDLKQNNWETLGSFDTSKNDTMIQNGTTGTEMQRAINLKQGLNKIIVSGVSSIARGDTPFIGNLTFTLMNQTANRLNENSQQDS
ncbi:FIVAR domain-containing protein [Mycoplasma tullyi]|uniref:FIVAR domain-containing protein n=1 Tax=Mycoplasma tullyi TaxID=1612150 RepID=A0A7D7U267_9MOLU|nr:FIVAR domain-containing protein [Mycoplasma tullyi]QMT98251.1 FIVAR domain-containing protein [Mycoplasma tullyi]